MTFIIVTGDPASGKSNFVSIVRKQNDIVHEDVSDIFRLEAINQRYANHKETDIHWIIINPLTKLFRCSFNETLQTLHGNVIELNICKGRK